MKPKQKRLTKKDKLILKAPEILQGKPIMTAAQEVGYSPLSRKMYDGNIKEQMIAKFKITEEEVVRRFDTIFDKAMNKDDLGNASRSSEALARINGMFKDKLETTSKNEPVQARNSLLKALDDDI